MNKRPSLFYSLLPIIFLVSALFVNVRIFGDSSLDGSNQLILLLSAGFAAVLAKFQGIKTDDIWNGIQGTLQDSTKAVLILLMVGALTGSWMISGIMPTLIVFGLKILSPIICVPAPINPAVTIPDIIFLFYYIPQVLLRKNYFLLAPYFLYQWGWLLH